MGFQLRTPAGEVIADFDVDHRLVKSVIVGPASAAVPLNSEFATISLDFRSTSDLELQGTDFDEDAEEKLIEFREYLGLLNVPASKTEAEVEAELKEEVGMKESLPPEPEEKVVKKKAKAK